MIAAISAAQDLSWSQPTTARLYLNPAFAGTDGRYSAAAAYRDQWNSISSSYKTALVSADFRLGSEKQPLGLNGGVLFYNDISSSGMLRTNGFGLAASSLVNAGKNLSVGAGAAFHIIRTSLFPERFSWGSQYNGQNFDPNLPSGEENASFFNEFVNLQAGVAILFEKNPEGASQSGNTRILAGYAADHLNRPDIGVHGSPEIMSIKHSLYADAYFPVNNENALKPRLLAQLQGPHMAVTAGGLWRHTLGQDSRTNATGRGAAGFSFGVLYRVMDAIIPTVEFEKKSLLIGFSYDINISALTPASKLRGGAELSIRLRPSHKSPADPVPSGQPSTRSPGL